MKKFRALIIVLIIILTLGSVVGILAATTDKLDGFKDKINELIKNDSSETVEENEVTKPIEYAFLKIVRYGDQSPIIVNKSCMARDYNPNASDLILDFYDSNDQIISINYNTNYGNSFVFNSIDNKLILLPTSNGATNTVFEPTNVYEDVSYFIASGISSNNSGSISLFIDSSYQIIYVD